MFNLILLLLSHDLLHVHQVVADLHLLPHEAVADVAAVEAGVRGGEAVEHKGLGELEDAADAAVAVAVGERQQHAILGN